MRPAMHKTITPILITVILLTVLGGCALSSSINTGNPLLVKNSQEPHATVYFIRPPEQRTRGVADGNVGIELNEIPLIRLGSSEYTVTHVKPGHTDVIMRSMTYLTTKPMPVEVWRARRIEFVAGKTYYIEARFTQEEFRGTYFVPTQVKPEAFRAQAARISPVGELARLNPLNAAR